MDDERGATTICELNVLPEWALARTPRTQNEDESGEESGTAGAPPDPMI
jgi:hypothetical protein